MNRVKSNRLRNTEEYLGVPDPVVETENLTGSSLTS